LGRCTGDPRPEPIAARRRSRESGIAGFSLLEVMAALVVTMLLVLALTPFVGQMLSTWTRGSEAARFVELATRGVAVLRADLRHAIAWTGEAGSADGAQFRGSEVSLSFLAATGLGPRRDGLQMISITIDASADGRALVRRSAPLVGAAHGSFADPVVLFSGPFSYRFKYHARKGGESPAWTTPNALPARVELSIVDEDGPIFATPLEFPVLATLSALCLANGNQPGCPNTQPKQEDVNRWLKDFGYTGD
jgi:hypothetical protein